MNVVRRRLLIPAAATAAAALGLTTLTACGGDSAAAGNTDKFDVVASFYPMAFLAEQIGGKHVNVTSLTQPGQEPHDLEISAKQTAALQESDAVLYLKGLQPSVDEAVAQSGPKTKIDAATLTSLEEHGNEVGGHAAEHDDEHGHEEEGGKDPHIWLDPVKYAEVAKGVGAALEKADPDHADTYKTNTEALVEKLGALNDQFTGGLKNTDTKVFITTHAAFGYLAERYGLTEEAISGLDPESEPSAARVKELEKMAKADGVTTVFYETLVSDKTAKTIAADANLKTDVLDPIEGITGKSRGKDYFAVQEANLKALQTALGAK
ncbi:metal ABC transporter substrate-binding protein [Streptomyces caniscabiei]|uniref:Zinc ABC transporter substrate-binding protein n=1 Tax=Streptomyces caniscabiei TaxID=2746961 RepID=A0A927L048_9ACTN|nr:metal ABC transporter substrate-binding protein [Streptomyces caniscabiei]MBD9701377.1 zinc ABC transporter substrate-binding protein [Streptomyces caniscabiei]MBD9723575.1 zinc ABC transporter substrate-binding protein [Streptomyces caniscabiei]MDX3511059.1 metal ABC transporter substrate-binding protein [Streptomyces caniscabiei]MDX3721139.1 metal ABC transporter substrate-binding protein [Streptomyces caniscabiei]MDX3725586.1 metal ABC transporter substrate-binding protein [Streptomyces 